MHSTFKAAVEHTLASAPGQNLSFQHDLFGIWTTEWDIQRDRERERDKRRRRESQTEHLRYKLMPLNAPLSLSIICPYDWRKEGGRKKTEGWLTFLSRVIICKTLTLVYTKVLLQCITKLTLLSLQTAGWWKINIFCNLMLFFLAQTVTGLNFPTNPTGLVDNILSYTFQIRLP